MDAYGAEEERRFNTTDVAARRRPASLLGLSSRLRAPSVGQVTAATDVVMLAIATVAANTLWAQPGDATSIPAAYALMAFISMHALAPRRGRIHPTVVKDVGWVLQRMALPLLVLLPFLDGSPKAVATIVPVAIAAVIAGRIVGSSALRRARVRGSAWDPCLIVGTGEVGQALARVLLAHPEYGLQPLGFVGDSHPDDSTLPLLGKFDDLPSVARDRDVTKVVVADPERSDAAIARMLTKESAAALELYVAPRLPNVGVVPGTQWLWGIPLVHIDRSIFRTTSRAVKRLTDIVLASAALIFLSPVLAVAAIATRLSSPGPILFRQTRVGRNHQPFDMLKFRTMTVSDGPDTAWSGSESDEARQTRVGRVLRRSSIDELPQLFNVLRGSMSLVGPRPERPYFVEQFSEAVPGYYDRHRVHGGMTGLAQTHGCRQGSMDAIPIRAHFDNQYIENWSWWNDIAIMLRTFRLVVVGDEPVSHDQTAAFGTSPPDASSEGSDTEPILDVRDDEAPMIVTEPSGSLSKSKTHDAA